MRSYHVCIAMAVMLCSFTVTRAQSSGGESHGSEFYLNAVTGISAPGLNNFNNVLKGAGFLPFNGVYLSRGGGFFTVSSKSKLASIFTFSTYSGSKKDGENSNWLRATQVGTSLGIVIKNRNGFQLIPYGGLAYSFFGARVSGNTATGGSFNDYFESAANQHHVSNNQFMVNAGLHIAKTRLGKSMLGQKLLIGGRFGYYIPLGDGSWKSDNIKLEQGPKINAGGFYASFILGIRQ